MGFCLALCGLLRASLAPTEPAATAGPPPVLNHAYVWIDSTLYDALRTSALVRDTLAVVREATVRDLRTSWTGLYLFGERTYVELYRAGAGTPAPGTIAIAWGTDTRGTVAGITASLGATGRAPRVELRRRPEGADTLDWFTHVEMPSADTLTPPLRWWYMEYAPDYLARRTPPRPDLAGRVDRAAYLARLADTTRALRDLVGMTIAVPPGDIERLSRELTALGLTSRRSGDTLLLQASDAELRLIPSSSNHGLRRMDLALRRPISHAVRLDGSSLAVRADAGASVAQLLALPASPPDACPLEAAMIEVGARQVAVCRGGSGTALVVFESGLGDGYGNWRGILDSTARFARVLAYARAGLGGSSAVAGPRDGSRVANELAQLLDAARESGPVVLVGHSLGGMYARVMAHRFPDRVRGLVLVDPTPEGFEARQREVLGTERFEAQIVRILSQLGSGPARAEWDGMAATRQQAAAARVRLPSVVLSAGRVQNPDTVIGRRVKTEWLALHRDLAGSLGGRHDIVPHAGHYVHAEAPDRVVAAIREVVGQAR